MQSISSCEPSPAPESDYTREVDRAVAEVRADKKWKVEYMRLIERDMEKMRLGEYKGRVALARNSRNRFDSETLSGILMIHPKTLQAILETIDEHPDWDDEEVAEHIDFE